MALPNFNFDSEQAAFKTTIETWREPHNMRDTVRVLIERKDATPSPAVRSTGEPQS